MELLKIIKKSYRYIVSFFCIPYHIKTIFILNKLPISENGYVVVSPSLTLSGAPLLSKAIHDDINERNNSDCLLMSIYGGECNNKDWNAINLLGCNINFINSIIVKVLIGKGYDRFICNSVVSASLLAKNISSNGG